MLGAIIGDIVGSRWEFNPTNDYNFEWLCDYGESIHEWCNRYPHPMGGYGGRFAQWVRSDDTQPYN